MKGKAMTTETNPAGNVDALVWGALERLAVGVPAAELALELKANGERLRQLANDAQADTGQPDPGLLAMAVHNDIGCAVLDIATRVQERHTAGPLRLLAPTTDQTGPSAGFLPMVAEALHSLAEKLR